MSSITRLMMVNFTEGDLAKEQWAALKRAVDDIRFVSEDAPDFYEHLVDAEGLIFKLGGKADRSLLERAPKLRYIGMYGTGYGKIDVEAARSHDIVVTNVRDYATQSVAEFVVAAAITVLRDLAHQLQDADELGFLEPAALGRTLAGRRVGIIGLGAIGRRTADLLRALGAEVSYYSRSRHPDAEAGGVPFKELEDLVASSEVISLHIPSVPDTPPLLSADLVMRISPGSLLINTSPNEIVDLTAVEERLTAGTLQYVLDHTDEFDPPDIAGRLAAYATCWAYPPVGYMTEEADEAKRQALVDNIVSFVDGTPQSVVS